MEKIKDLLLKFKVFKDTCGQDLIEYALMAGFVAVAAGAIMPGIADSIQQIWCLVLGVLINASGGDVTPVGNCSAGSSAS